jgi:hypothetical protein
VIFAFVNAELLHLFSTVVNRSDSFGFGAVHVQQMYVLFIFTTALAARSTAVACGQ